jgi:hypothetical protein
MSLHFTTIFCELIFVFHFIVTFPSMAMWIPQALPELKDTIFAAFCEQQQQSATMRTGLKNALPFYAVI